MNNVQKKSDVWKTGYTSDFFCVIFYTYLTEQEISENDLTKERGGSYVQF